MVFNLFKLFENIGANGSIVKPATRDNVIQEWNNIGILVRSKGPSQLRQALLSADKTLDNVLRDKVFGENMGERLKNAKDLFTKEDYDRIWAAHKMRNALVHESGYEPIQSMLITGIEVFRKAVNTLGVRV